MLHSVIFIGGSMNKLFWIVCFTTVLGLYNYNVASAYTSPGVIIGNSVGLGRVIFNAYPDGECSVPIHPTNGVIGNYSGAEIHPETSLDPKRCGMRVEIKRELQDPRVDDKITIIFAHTPYREPRYKFCQIEPSWPNWFVCWSLLPYNKKIYDIYETGMDPLIRLDKPQ